MATTIANMQDSKGIFADLDNDNDKDLVLTGREKISLFEEILVTRVYRNLGNATFRESLNTKIDGVRSPDLDVSDFDNDGDMDLMVVGQIDDLEVASANLWANQLINPTQSEYSLDTSKPIVFPNPTSDVISLKGKNLDQIQSYALISANGQAILPMTAYLPHQNIHMPASPGLYLLVLYKRDGERLHYKVVKNE